MLCYIVICYFKILILYTLKPASFRCGLFFRFFVNCWGYSYQMRTNFIHLLFQSMMKGFFGSLWWGCGCPVDTSAKQKHRPSRQARHCQQSWLRERKYQIFRLLHSLPPSFASQNPPPSSEGGKAKFKLSPTYNKETFFIKWGYFVQTRIALIAIIVENSDSVAELNALLHQYGEYIIGRMGLPYRKCNVSILSVAVDAPQDVISTLSGKIGKLDGVSVKTAYSNVVSGDE